MQEGTDYLVSWGGAWGGAVGGLGECSGVEEDVKGKYYTIELEENKKQWPAEKF